MCSMLGACRVVGAGLGKASGSPKRPARTADKWQFPLSTPQGGPCNAEIIWNAGQGVLLPTCVVPWRLEALAADCNTSESWLNGSVVKEGCVLHKPFGLFVCNPVQWEHYLSKRGET